MLEFLLLITFSGLVLASHRCMGLANPFQIYFFVWFLIFFGYYSSAESYIKVSSDFLAILLLAKGVSFLFLVVVFNRNSVEELGEGFYLFDIKNERHIFIFQIVVFFVAPFSYLRALYISGGADIFSGLGFVQLRLGMIEYGLGYGFFAYFFVLSYIVSSISVILFLAGRIGYFRLISSVLLSLFYVYLGTGRTSALLFVFLILVPLILVNKIKLKGIFIFSILVFLLFIFIASMTSKGVSYDVGFAENVDSFLENIRSYTVAPFLALSQLIKNGSVVDFGGNTFRTVVALFYGLGVIDVEPLALIRGYEYVPDQTNVYTVYESYFRDFSYFGLFVPPFFLIGHWWLYKGAKRSGGSWIFYYASSVYPLVMQFFQDQYFSLLSTWIQVWFWYWFFLNPRKISIVKMRIYHE